MFRDYGASSSGIMAKTVTSSGIMAKRGAKDTYALT
jgi:hypothetical protein